MNTKISSFCFFFTFLSILRKIHCGLYLIETYDDKGSKNGSDYGYYHQPPHLHYPYIPAGHECKPHKGQPRGTEFHGWCLDHHGKDQRSGQHSLGTFPNKDACWNVCRQRSDITGCEFNTIRNKCFYYTTSVAFGDGQKSYYCLTIKPHKGQSWGIEFHGWCLDHHGKDQESGQHSLGTFPNKDACWNVCRQRSDITGCEFNTNHNKCFYHTTSVASGDGQKSYYCLTIKPHKGQSWGIEF